MIYIAALLAPTKSNGLVCSDVENISARKFVAENDVVLLGKPIEKFSDNEIREYQVVYGFKGVNAESERTVKVVKARMFPYSYEMQYVAQGNYLIFGEKNAEGQIIQKSYICKKLPKPSEIIDYLNSSVFKIETRMKLIIPVLLLLGGLAFVFSRSFLDKFLKQD